MRDFMDAVEPLIEADIGRRVEDYAIESPVFRAWFGASKVIDARGQPLIVYHGTRAGFDAFKHGQRVSHRYHWNDNGLGFFFTPDAGLPSDSGPWSGAAQFAGMEQREGEPVAASGSNIIPAYLSIQSPYRMGYNEFIDAVRVAGSGEALRMRLETLGYDGVFRENVSGGGIAAYVAFRPEQIKSVFNRGTWSGEKMSECAGQP